MLGDINICFAEGECCLGSARFVSVCICVWGFPDSSAGKESACNAREPSSISGWICRMIGYPLQYSWVFLVTQLIQNLPAMRETWVQSLGGEDSLEKGMATHSSILASSVYVCVKISETTKNI